MCQYCTQQNNESLANEFHPRKQSQVLSILYTRPQALVLLMKSTIEQEANFIAEIASSHLFFSACLCETDGNTASWTHQPFDFYQLPTLKLISCSEWVVMDRFRGTRFAQYSTSPNYL